jgi:hypothetical protein
MQVMTMLRDAKKPVVGYNCFDDIVYVLTNFGSLRKTWPQFQNDLQEYFPEGVYDIKHMCISLEGTRPGLFPSNVLPLNDASQIRLYAHLCNNPNSTHKKVLDSATARTGSRCASRDEISSSAVSGMRITCIGSDAALVLNQGGAMAQLTLPWQLIVHSVGGIGLLWWALTVTRPDVVSLQATS